MTDNTNIERLNYFTGQFLEADDFKAEQEYHIRMRRFGNRVLYLSAGILDGGFEVQKISDSEISISSGIGIDAQGRELIIITPLKVEVPIDKKSMTLNITLEYVEKEAETSSDTFVDTEGISVTGRTRIAETPVVGFPEDANITNDQIKIAKITLDANGKIGSIDKAERQFAHARFPRDLIVGQGSNGRLSVRHIDGKSHQNDTSDDLFLNWSTGKNVYLGFGPHGDTKSSLFVSGDIALNGKILYNNGRSMKKILNGADFKSFGTRGGYVGPLDGNEKNFIGLEISRDPPDHLEIYTAFTLPLNAIINSVKVYLLHGGQSYDKNTGEARLKVELALKKFSTTRGVFENGIATGYILSDVLNSAFVSLPLSSTIPISGDDHPFSEEIDLELTTIENDRKTMTVNESFCIDIRMSGTKSSERNFIFLSWIEINYLMYEL